MRISDWSSDVCSSDLLPVALTGTEEAHHHQLIAVNAASTFETYGYRIRVGKVVPTREGAFLHDEPADGRIPLLWASDIRANGSFRFQDGTRTANARSEEHTSELQSLMRI